MRYLVKGLIYLASLCLLLALGAAAIIPALLSTQRGTQWLSREISKTLQAKASIDKLHLSLFDPQEIQGVHLEKTGDYTFHLDRLAIDAPLWKLLVPSADLGVWHIEKPQYQFSMKALQEEPLASDEEEPASQSAFDPSILFSRRVQIELSGGQISCQLPTEANSRDVRRCEMRDIALHLQTQGVKNPAEIKLQALTQAQHGAGEISLEASVESPLALAQTLKLQFALKQFPLDVLVPFTPAPYSGLIHQWSQVPANLQAQVARQETYGDYSLHIDTKPLVGQLKFKENKGSFTLLEPANFTATLSAQELNMLLQAAQMGPRVNGAKTPSFKTQIKLKDFDIDLKQLSSWSLDSEFTTTALALEHGAAKSVLSALKGTLVREDNVAIKIASQDSAAMAIAAELTIGNSLRPQDLLALTLDASRIQSADLALWAPFPSQELAWLFPASFKLNVKENAQTFDFDIKGLMGASTLESKGNLERDILCLESLDVHIPSVQTASARASGLELSASQVACDLSEAVATLKMQLKASIKQLLVPSPAVTLDELELTLHADKGHFDHVLTSSLLRSKGSWQLREDKLSLLQPLELSLQVPNSQLKAIAPQAPITSDLEAQLSVDPNSWHLKGNLAAQAFKMHAKIHGLSVQQPNHPLYQLADLHAQVSSNFAFDQLSLAMNASPLLNEHPSCALSLNGTLNAGGVNAKITLNKLPTSLIDAFSDMGLSSLIGNECNVDGQLVMQQGQKHVVSQVSTPSLKVSAKLTQPQNGAWSLTSPASLSWSLDETGYNALDNFLTSGSGALVAEDTLSLKKPCNLAIELSRLELAPDHSQLAVAGTITLDEFQLIEKTSGRLSSIDHLSANFEHDPVKNLTTAQAKGHFQVKEGSEDLQGPLALGIQIKDFQAPPSTPVAPTPAEPTAVASQEAGSKAASPEPTAMERAQIDLELTSQQLPCDFIDLGLRWSSNSKALAGMSLVELAGPSLELQLKTHLKAATGPFALQLHSPYMQAELDATLKSGALTLNKPMKAQLALSPKLSQHLNQEMGISVKEGNGPFTLQVSEKEFSAAVMPLKLDAVNLATGHLEIGQLQVPNKGMLNLALTLLRAPKAGSSKTANLWFTPIDFSIAKGVLNLERIDILAADAFPLAFWGQVDLPQSIAHLCLGITGPAFERALALSDLPAGYTMLFPIEGPLASASIDMTAGAAKITSLLALKSPALSGVLSLNPAAKLVVGAVQSKLPLPDGSAKVPPSRYEAPWHIEPVSKPISGFNLNPSEDEEEEQE